MTTCCGKNAGWGILPVQLRQNVSVECFLRLKSQASAGKALQAWWSLSGCGQHDVVFLTPVSLCQPPTLSCCPTTLFLSLTYHLPHRMSYHTCPRSHCDLTCSNINYATGGWGVGSLLLCINIRKLPCWKGTAGTGGISPLRHRWRKSADVSAFCPGLLTWPNWMTIGSSGRGAASDSASVINFCRACWLTPSPMHCCEKKGRTVETCVRVCVWLIDHTGRWLVVRCVHQSRYLANDAWAWKWPGSSPDPTHRAAEWTLLCLRWVPTIRWLPSEVCKKKEACCVLTDAAAGTRMCDGWTCCTWSIFCCSRWSFNVRVQREQALQLLLSHPARGCHDWLRQIGR